MSIINSYKPKESGGTVLTSRAVGSLVIMSKEIENPEPKYIDIGTSSNSVYVIPSDYPKLANVYMPVLRESTTPIVIDHIAIANDASSSDLTLGVIREGESYRYFTLENLDINTIQYIGDVHYDSNIVNPFYCNGRYYFLTASRTISTISADNLSNITTESVPITGIEITDDNIATFSITYHPGVNKYYAINNSPPCIEGGTVKDGYKTIHISDDGINFTSYDIEFGVDSYYSGFSLNSIIYANNKLYIYGIGTAASSGSKNIVIFSSVDGISLEAISATSSTSIPYSLYTDGYYIYPNNPTVLSRYYPCRAFVFDTSEDKLRTLRDATSSILTSSISISSLGNSIIAVDNNDGVLIYDKTIVDDRFPIIENSFDPLVLTNNSFLFISDGNNIVGIISNDTSLSYSNYRYFTKLLSYIKFFSSGVSSTGYTKKYYMYTGEEE